MREFALRTPLLAHQLRAVEKLEPLKVGALFMEMGTGKTRTAIELLHRRRDRVSRLLWCCPASIMENARREFLKHTSIPPERIHVVGPRTHEDSVPDADVYIVSLEGIGGSARVVHVLDRLADADAFMVVDESTYIKGHRAKRTQRLELLGRRVRYRLVLTGTPFTQGIEDLYSQMAFLSKKILGYESWYTFASHHIRWDEDRRGMIDKRIGVDWVAKRIEPYSFQVRKAECLDLPPKTFSSVRFPLSREQKEAYAAAKERFVDEMLADEEADPGILIYKLFSALQSIVSGINAEGLPGPKLLRHGRLAALFDAMRNVPPSEPVVVWTKYVRSVDEICSAAPDHDREAFRFCGDVPPAERSRILDRWSSEGGLLVATLGTGAHGLDMTAASTVFFYANDWKYSTRVQAEDRCHRIGQTRSVHYVDLVAEDCVDERIAAALDRKADALAEFKTEIDRGGRERLAAALREL